MTMAVIKRFKNNSSRAVVVLNSYSYDQSAVAEPNATVDCTIEVPFHPQFPLVVVTAKGSLRAWQNGDQAATSELRTMIEDGKWVERIALSTMPRDVGIEVSSDGTVQFNLL